MFILFSGNGDRAKPGFIDFGFHHEPPVVREQILLTIFIIHPGKMSSFLSARVINVHQSSDNPSASANFILFLSIYHPCQWTPMVKRDYNLALWLFSQSTGSGCDG